MGHHHHDHFLQAPAIEASGSGARHRVHGRVRPEAGGPPWGGGRRRMRRGAIRRALLGALETEPAHGYEIMRRLEERSGGIWRPSPGSVYPTLQMLEDEGMVRSQSGDGTRVYELTEAGRQELAQSPAPGNERPPWDGAEGADGWRTFRQAVGQLAAAARMVSQAGSPAQVDRGIEIVQRARKELYQILSED